MKYDWDSIDPDDLSRLRDRLLRRQVRFQLYAHGAFYRKALDDLGVKADGFAGFSDLHKLPLVGRDVLARASEDFVLRPTTGSIRRWSSARQLYTGALDRMLRGVDYAGRELANEYEIVHSLETQGTTGESIPIHLSRRDLAVLATQGSRMLQVAGVTNSDVVINLLEPIASGAFWPVWFGGVSLGLRQFAPGPLAPQEAASWFRRSDATVLIARAEDALALFGETEGGLPGVRLVIAAPETVSPELRRRLMESAGGVPVIFTYRFAEGRAVWTECIQGGGYPDAGFHLSPDIELLETVSPWTLEPAKLGEAGEVVFTSLDQRGTAVARYRPGDIAKGGIVSGRCRYCARIVDRIVGPIVRAANFVQLRINGGEPVGVDIEALAAALAHPAVESWQVEISKEDGDPRGADELFVRFSPKNAKDPAMVAVELDRILRTEMGLSASQFVLAEDTEEGILDRRPVPVGEQRVVRTDGQGQARHVRLWRTPEQSREG